MNNRTVLAWLAAAIAVGVAAYFVINKGAGSGSSGSGATVPSGQKVLAIDPARVVKLTVDRGALGGAGAGEEVVSRRPGTDDWTLAEPKAGGGSWPVATSRISAMLRLLADMRATAEPDKGATVGDGATTVRIELDDGTVTTLHLAARTLAGAGLLAVDPPAGSTDKPRIAMVDDNIHRALRDPGPRGWRASSVLAGFDPNPSRVRLESASGVLALRRVEGRWGLTEPVVAPADPAKVAALMKSLGELAIVDFLDTPPGPPTATTGLDPASSSITIESDGPPPAKRTVGLGGPSDASGKHLYARIDGTRTVAVDATAIASVAMTPATYIAGPASALAAPDVGSMVMTDSGAVVSNRLIREADGWTEVSMTGRGSLLPESMRSAVNDALKFLMERPATEIAVSAPKGYTVVGTLELGGLDGRALETLEVGAADGPMLVLKSGAVYRSYPLPAAPAVLRAWVEPKAPKTGPALGPDGKPLEPTK